MAFLLYLFWRLEIACLIFSYWFHIFNLFFSLFFVIFICFIFILLFYFFINYFFFKFLLKVLIWFFLKVLLINFNFSIAFGFVRCRYFTALVLICFCLTKGRVTFFHPKKLLRVSFILWCYFPKWSTTFFSKYQFVVLVFEYMTPIYAYEPHIRDYTMYKITY